MAKGKGKKAHGRQQSNHKSKKDKLNEVHIKKREDESDDEESEGEVDYAAGADAFASDDDIYSEEEKDGGSNHNSPSSDDGSEQGRGDDDDGEDSSDDDDDDSDEEQEDVTAVFKGVAMRNDDSENDSNENDDNESASSSEDDEVSKGRQVSKTTKSSELCTFDLRNLVAMNSHQISSSSLLVSEKKKKAANNNSGNMTIPSNDHGNVVDEEFLLAKATEGCTQLVQALFQLPTEKSDAGPLAELPSYDEIRLPRSLPPPPPKQETRWEKFAKEKGIPLNKEKRSRKVWDEVSGTWMFRHGYEKANKSASDKEWPIMEVKDNEDPFSDPWEKLRDAKRARKDKNAENRLRNEERAGAVPKGTTNRVVKSREQVRKAGKLGGNMDRDSLPVGIPVDIKPDRKTATNVDSTVSKLRGKASTLAALAATQRSTASLGMYDAMREGEPERKKALSKLKKRKLHTSTDKKVLSTEGERSMKILKTVVDSTTGNVSATAMSKDKLRRKGHFAKGETAYDYDYDDGLGPSTFNKKKGRAGAGKMRKMTKKRAK